MVWHIRKPIIIIVVPNNPQVFEQNVRPQNVVIRQELAFLTSRFCRWNFTEWSRAKVLAETTSEKNLGPRLFVAVHWVFTCSFAHMERDLLSLFLQWYYGRSTQKPHSSKHFSNKSPEVLRLVGQEVAKFREKMAEHSFALKRRDWEKNIKKLWNM